MKSSEIELPSNKKFGLFFTFIFAVSATYFYISENMVWAYLFITIAIIFLVTTLVRAKLLLSLNKSWMLFGIVLGKIISPIVLGVIFFGLFMPIAIFMRLSGRDELKLKLSNKVSHWIVRRDPIKSDSFKNQF